MIYFLRRRDAFIKIGTTENFHLRLSQLIAEHGDLELLGLMNGSYDVEQRLHEQFREHRQGRTEWFAPCQELLTFIERNSHRVVPEKLPLPAGKMSSRVAVKPETHRKFLDFTHGLGTTFDEALNFMLDLVIGGEDGLVAGYQFREKLEQFRTKKPDIHSETENLI